jgi:hypothetical protein
MATVRTPRVAMRVRLILGMLAVAELPALNSFFARPAAREPTLGALRAFLAKLPDDGRRRSCSRTR